jgi:hypothetical protein
MFDWFEDAIEYAKAANHPIPINMIVSKALVLILKTQGQYKEACKEWKYSQHTTCTIQRSVHQRRHIKNMKKWKHFLPAAPAMGNGNNSLEQPIKEPMSCSTS